MRALLFLIFLYSDAHASQAGAVESEVGTHEPLFIFEKNENSQNHLVVYSVLNEQCQFESHKDQPKLDFYWLMEGKHFKPTHQLIKYSIRQRLNSHWLNETKTAFKIEIDELKELRGLSPKSYLLIEAKPEQTQCKIQVKFFESLEDKNPIFLESIYSHTRRKLLPPFRKLEWISLRGVDPETGKMVSSKFLSR